jgi:phenylalanyl-tRNA synthetase beta subunit
MISAISAEKPEHTFAALEALDIFQPEQQVGTKNVSFRLTIASIERTLKSDEVNDLLDRAAESAATELGAARI